jgi:hypothetical protein
MDAIELGGALFETTQASAVYLQQACISRPGALKTGAHQHGLALFIDANGYDSDGLSFLKARLEPKEKS